MKRKAIVFLAVGLLGSSFGGPLARYLPEMAALTIAFWRMAGASALLWGASSAWPQGRLPRRSLPLVLMAGILLALHFACFYAAVKRVPIANATLFTALAPLFTLIYERFVLHRKLPGGALLGVWIALTGVLVIQGFTLQLDNSYTVGNLLALASSVFLAAVLILAERIRYDITNTLYTRWLYLFAAITLALLALTSGIELNFETADIKWLLALAILPTLIGHNSMNYAVKYIRPTFVGAMPLGEPVLASIIAWILFGETVPGQVLIGGTITLTGLILVSIKR